MRIVCPACGFTAEVDPTRIPPGGARARCPRCTKSFPVMAPAGETGPPVDAAATVVCPACGAGQHGTEICDRCGVVFAKFHGSGGHGPATGSRMSVARDTPEVPPDGGAADSVRFGNGRGELLAWAEAGRLSLADIPAALCLAGTLPTPSSWRRFLDGVALWLAAVFLGTAVIFFIAYNWRDMGHYSRFALVELLLVAAVLAAWRLGLERMSGKAALLVATLMVGGLLALEGQTYQTGADPWELFATWALFVLPWVAISRFAPLWLVMLAMVDLSVGLYYQAFGGLFGIVAGTEQLWWTLAGVNTAALAIWEVAAGRGVPWLAERWPLRVVATATAGFITLLVAWAIVDHETAGLAEWGGYLLCLACAYAVYRHRLRDIYILALGVLSVVTVVTVFLSRFFLRGDDAAAFLIIGTTVLGLSAAGGWWLRRVAREGDA